MKKIFLMLMTVVVASFFTACGDSGANTASKPANAAASNANTASAPVDPKAAEVEVRKLMDTAQAALSKNDADAMDKIYADNYTLVNIDGSIQTKAERLASLRSGETKYTAFAYSESNIRINNEGTGAVAIAKLSMKGTSKGKPVDGDYRVTQVYSKTKDGWKQVSAQATKIEGGSAKPDDKAKADDKSKMEQKTGNVKMDALAADDGGNPPPKKK